MNHKKLIMNIVTFPMLNLKFNIDNVAFSIFGFDIYWYAILIVSAMLISICIFKMRDGLYEIKFSDVIDLAVYLIPISIVSARIYYVIFNLQEYLENPIRILNFRGGGLAIYGGIIGGLITCAIFCKKRKIKLLNLLDFVAPGIALGQAIGRWGNFINIEAYGVETTLPWRMGIYESGKYIEVHPTFLYESLATFILFIILLKIKNKRKFEGQLTCIYFMWYSFVRMFIEGLRTDSLKLGTIRISQLLSLIIFIVSVIFYARAKKTNKK